MTNRIDFDLETYSNIDLTEVGLYPYAAHDSTEVLCACWAFGDVTGHWLPHMPPPSELFDLIAAGNKVHAHNCAFDAELWRMKLSEDHGWAWVGYDNFIDTMATGQIYNLPGHLDMAARFVTGEGKDKAGYQHMLKMCRPAKAVKASSDPKRHHTQENIEKLLTYCHQDVKAEAGFMDEIPTLSPTEEEVWRETWRMNRRGVLIDYSLVAKLQALAHGVQNRYRAQLSEATGGLVDSETLRKRLGEFLSREGAKLPLTKKGNPSFSKDSADLVDMSGATADAVEALRLYNILNNSSLAKLTKMQACRGSDDRVRGSTCYAGAGQTGRWAGRDIQLQNLPRGIIETVPAYESALDTVRSGATWQDLELLYGGNALPLLSTLIRCCIIPKAGHQLIAADYAAIEGRVLAWAAGQKDDLAAYASGKRMYAVAAAGIFGCSYEQVMAEKAAGHSAKDKIGKVSVLSCGYGGSVNAFIQFGGAKLGLTTERMKEIVAAWRESHPMIVKFWKRCEEAAFAAIRNRSQAYACEPVVFGCTAKDLIVKLPSGRKLYFHSPRITTKTWDDGRTSPQIEYYGVDEGKVGWISTYGGRLTGVIIQAMARDLMAHASLKAAEAGFQQIITVHDELVCEEPINGRTHEDLCRVMEDAPTWASCIPVVAEGFSGQFYRKG